MSPDEQIALSNKLLNILKPTIPTGVAVTVVVSTQQGVGRCLSTSASTENRQNVKALLLAITNSIKDPT